jgi:hypothetical protein
MAQRLGLRVSALPIAHHEGQRAALGMPEQREPARPRRKLGESAL